MNGEILKKSNKLKIIVVHFMFSPYGGGEVIAYNTYKLLQKQGHDAYFFGMDYKPYFEDCKSTKYFCKALRNDNIINYLIDLPKSFYNIDAAKKFGTMLDEIKPDIVHVHTLDKLSYSILGACIKRKIPIVKTEHSAKIACPSESLFYKSSQLCKKHLCVKGNYLYCVLNKCYRNSYYFSIIRSIINFINDFTCYNNKVNIFISPSTAVKNILLEKGIEANRIKVIENFYNSSFSDVEPTLVNKNYFLFAGRLYNFKGLKTLFDAINNLPKEIEFHIAGTGAMEEELKEYANRYNLFNVKFLGFLNKEKLLNEYRGCIATITPSIWMENFPTTTLESFINAKPVIGSNIGGIPEQIEHNKTGLLFEAGNVEQLKECILTYWNNPNLAVEHGKNAHLKAKIHYTETRYYNSLMETYKKVLKGQINEKN